MAQDTQHEMFGGAAPPPERNWKAIAIGLAMVAVIVGIAVVLFGRGAGENKAVSGNDPAPAAAYASQLPLSDVKMSTADIGTGGQIYYVTGHVQNTGDKTVNGATLELLFKDNMGQACQRDHEPLRVIVATEPALDVTDLAHAPLKPGQGRDFQIAVERISAQWNGQYPTLTVVQASTQ